VYRIAPHRLAPSYKVDRFRAQLRHLEVVAVVDHDLAPNASARAAEASRLQPRSISPPVQGG
jgi:hypothetical protein